MGDRKTIDDQVLRNVDRFLETEEESVQKNSESLPISGIGIMYDLDGVLLNKNGPRIQILHERNNLIHYLQILTNLIREDKSKALEKYYQTHRFLLPSLFPDLLDTKALFHLKAQYNPDLPDFQKLIADGTYVSIRAVLKKNKNLKKLLPFYDILSNCEELYTLFDPIVPDVVDRVRRLRQTPHIATLEWITGTLEKHRASVLRNPVTQQVQALESPHFKLEMRNEKKAPHHTQIDPLKAARAGLYALAGKWRKVIMIDDTPFQLQLIDYLREKRPEIYRNVYGIHFNQHGRGSHIYSWDTLPHHPLLLG